MRCIFIGGLLLAQELSLSEIWREYRYYAQTHELVAGGEAWYGQTEEGKVFRITKGLQVETLGVMGLISRWLPYGKGGLIWGKLRRAFRHSSYGELLWWQGTEQRPLPGSSWYEAALLPNGEGFIAADANNLYLWRGSGWDTLTHYAGQQRAGTADWLYEEEFSITRTFEIAPSAQYVAYLLLDNTHTPIYPLLLSRAQSYPYVQPIPYPRVGQRNPIVELHVYDLISRKDRRVWVDSVGGYIPWLGWSPMGDELYFVHLGRAQNRFTLYRYEVGQEAPKPFFSDSTAGFFTWDNRKLLVWRSDQPELFYLAGGKGTWEIWHYDYKGRRLGIYAPAGLRSLIGYAHGKLFFHAEGKTPKDQRIGYIPLRRGASPVWLTSETGWAEGEITGDLLWIKESRFLEPYREKVCDVSHPERCLEFPDLNAGLRQRMPKAQVRFLTYPGGDGRLRWGYLMLPASFDSTRRYPVILTFYGGPGSQQVSEEFKNLSFFWQAYLVQRGYIVACADGRGTALYPTERFSVYRKLGLLEAEDLAAFVRYLRSLRYVGRIGAFGWSYGGYMAIRLAFAAPEGLAAAVAVAPVTDWRLYDSAYTERFMDLAESNKEGYETTALPPRGVKLQVPLLIMHGDADENVHPQHTYEFLERLLRGQPEAPVEWRIFPGQNHGIGTYRYRVYWEVERFFERHLRE
ncbi:MAG: prolyl oligopeptidase family serine peptidase [Bacteroidia bacterium]|nr:prolyl oligopeptidase family serine peptidase [Bacteroidia bacterium]MDW8058207.1 prolyl oligopeptidase family serine peptidase [Bacteroidia bacterium]